MTTQRDGTRRDAGRPSLGRADGGEDGSALAVSVLVILVVTVLAAAGWSLAAVELDASRDFRGETEAFYVADRGLNQYRATDAADLDTAVTYQFETGTATVTPERITAGMANNEELYRVTSTGAYRRPDGTVVRRSTSTVLLATPMLPVSPDGNFVSGGKLIQNGNADFDGRNDYGGGDQLCEASDVSTDSLPGMVADSFQNSGGATGCTAKKGTITPDPPGAVCEDDPLDDFMSANQWQTLLGMEADHTVSGNEDFPQTDGWEYVKVNGDYERDSGARTGQGILIVEGDFKSNGNFTWDGLILVGGSYTAEGNETVNGSIVTGLNSLLGANPSPTSIGNGTKDFQYNSCNVFKASRSKFRVSQVPGSWYENL